MSIPAVRKELYQLADQLAASGMPLIADHLRVLADRTTRKPSHFPRAKPHSVSLTAEQREAIREMKRKVPDLGLGTIAAAFGTNIGRVSEALGD